MPKKVAVLLKNTRTDFVPSLSLSVTYVSNRFPKIRNTSSIFSVITVSYFLSPDESRAIPSHVLFGIFPEITGRDQRFLLPSPIFRKKRRLFSIPIKKVRFVPEQRQSFICRCFNGTKARERYPDAFGISPVTNVLKKMTLLVSPLE